MSRLFELEKVENDGSDRFPFPVNALNCRACIILSLRYNDPFYESRSVTNESINTMSSVILYFVLSSMPWVLLITNIGSYL